MPSIYKSRSFIFHGECVAARWIYILSLHTTDNYRSRTRIYVLHIYTRATVSPVMGPYRLIDGDSRVGNPIHRAEDKFHVPQCVSKRGRVSEGGSARSTAVTSANYQQHWIRVYICVCKRIYMRTRGWCVLPPLVSSHVYTEMAGCRKFLATRIVWIAMPSGSSLRLQALCSPCPPPRPSPHPLPSAAYFFRLPRQLRVSILSRMHVASDRCGTLRDITDTC